MHGLLCQRKSHHVHTVKRKRQITWHISDLLFYLNNDAGFGGRADGITDYYTASLSIMVCPVCLVGLVFDWIMTRWAVTRDIDEQRRISPSMHTSNYLSMLCARWWTVTFGLNKCGLSKIKNTDESSSQITTTHQIWYYGLRHVHHDNLTIGF